MKTLTTILMAIVILAGIVLALTPLIANQFFPQKENQVRVAKEDAAILALQQWFKTPDARFIDVQALSKKTAQHSTSWFSFSVNRSAVERYILDKKLQQLEISDRVLNNVFSLQNPPASWWQPDAIDQQTYFTGEDQNRNVSLIYNPNTKRGVLVTTSEKM